MNMPKFAGIRYSAYITGVLFAILASVCNGFDTPLKQLFTGDVGPFMIIAFLFLGSAAGFALVSLIGCKTTINNKDRHVKKSDILFLIGVILTTLLANICVCLGLQTTSASSASVLLSFDTVVTVVIALLIYHEKVSKRLWIGVIFIVLGSIALAVKDGSAFIFNTGSLLILLAALFYGIRANISKKLSGKNPSEVVIIRGFGVFIIALPLGLVFGESIPTIGDAIALMFIGILTCGCVLFFTLCAQKRLGAAKTGAIYGISPLLGAVFAFIILGEVPSASFIAALILIIPGLYFSVVRNTDNPVPEETDTALHSDESPLLVNMSEAAKQHARNYFTAFGFVIMALPHIILILSEFGYAGGKEQSFALMNFTADYLAQMAPGIFLLICGIILLILRKRTLIGCMFLFNAGILTIYLFYSEDTVMAVGCGIFYLIFALILLTSKEKQKYLLAAVNIFCAAGLVSRFFGADAEVHIIYVILQIIAVLFLLYLAVASSAERMNFLLRDYIVCDCETPFSRTGTMVGFLYAAVLMSSWLLQDLGLFVTGSFVFVNLAGFICIGMLIITGILLLFIGGCRMMPVLLLGMALGFLMDIGYTATLPVVISILFLFLGVFAVMRQSPQLLSAIFCISCAFNLLLYYVGVLYPEVQLVMLLLDGIGLIIALYMALADFSEKPKLPVL
ncbi:MAG TPA: DMT family transporter [Methanocorpusculum sp.]|nr:DMT family transporter [Methanocorpusculum sp.]